MIVVGNYFSCCRPSEETHNHCRIWRDPTRKSGESVLVLVFVLVVGTCLGKRCRRNLLQVVLYQVCEENLEISDNRTTFKSTGVRDTYDWHHTPLSFNSDSLGRRVYDLCIWSTSSVVYREKPFRWGTNDNLWLSLTCRTPTRGSHRDDPLDEEKWTHVFRLVTLTCPSYLDVIVYLYHISLSPGRSLGTLGFRGICLPLERSSLIYWVPPTKPRRKPMGFRF